MLGHLAYLYVGSKDVERDLGFYLKGLGAELVWRHEAMGTEVAAVRMGPDPLVLLADHRPVPSVLPIWECPDLDAAVEALEASGWRGTESRVEVPDGPCVVLEDPSGNQLALLDRVRPNVLSQS
jgi:predicted enzyme related to lactoylglutathione lyase